MTDTPRLVERDRTHSWHPYTQMLTEPPPLPVVKASGVYLYTEDGRKILDGISSSLTIICLLHSEHNSKVIYLPIDLCP